MYDGIIFTDCKYINTFSYQYQDEGHRAWWVQDMQLDNKQSTNNNEQQHKLKQQSDKTIKKTALNGYFELKKYKSFSFSFIYVNIHSFT